MIRSQCDFLQANRLDIFSEKNMYMNMLFVVNRTIGGALAILVSLLNPAYAQTDSDTSKAVAAAEAFVALIDAGKYAESWDGAAEAFRKAVTKEQWQAAAAQVQAQAGNKTSRALMAGANAPKAMRNAQGEFIVVQFSSTFTKIPHVIEIVSPMRDTDGVFRVSGYFLRPDKSPAEKAAEAAAAVLPPKASFSDEEIKTILRERIDIAKRGVGIVVGLIDEKGTRIISYGKSAVDADKPVDGNSLFEIGSITKTFTAIVLADMAARGEVSLDDPIGKYLPKSVKTPVVNGKQITLEQLARHTSGLPRLPLNFKPKDNANPYADYSVAQLYEFLNGYEPTEPFGVVTAYSNFGTGLLGHILALRAGTDYDALVRTRILQPLKMDSTGITLTPPLQSRLATGHNGQKAVVHWDMPTLAGAGALRSSVNDMLKYLATNMGLTTGLDNKLMAAISRTHRIEADKAKPDPGIGLGWFLTKSFENNVIGHGGGTGGFQSYVAFEPQRKRGVVVLSNSNTEVSDIAIHLLDSRMLVTKYPAQ